MAARPETDGTELTRAMPPARRRALGAHYTGDDDIMKIVGPTLVEPWTALIEAAATPEELRRLRARLYRFRVLDPACGAGHFLRVAHREMQRLWALLAARWREACPGADPAGLGPSVVTGRQLLGIDVDPLAIALARAELPGRFLLGDALIDERGGARAWPEADVIIGNPPFLGAKHLKPARGAAYVRRLRELYPEVPGMADYCVYWFRKAHEALPAYDPRDPVAGRAGLVGTQNIRHHKSREGGLDVIEASGTIVGAVDNQPWSGDAAVHVSIVNWVKGSLPGGAPPTTAAARPRPLPLDCNKRPKRGFQGKIPGCSGFLLDAAERGALLGDSAEVILPYLTGRELLDEFQIKRWIIDFGARDERDAARFPSAFRHVQRSVLPRVKETWEAARASGSDMEAARREHLTRWWQLWNRRDELTARLAGMRRTLACSRVMRRPIMAFLSARVCPSDLVQVFALEDDYSFGVLQSAAHIEWLRRSSRLKIETDIRYSVREVFETFPWPQGPAFAGPSPAAVLAVADAGREIRRARASSPVPGGLRAAYRALDLPGGSALKDAHDALDGAVLQAYGFSPARDLLGQLLELNHEVARRIERGQGVVAPGVPPSCPLPERLVTSDCLGA